MILHNFPFVRVERAVLVQNLRRNSNLADVMQKPAKVNLFDLGLVQAEFFREQTRVGGHLLRVALRVVVFSVNSQRQRRNRLDHREAESPQARDPFRCHSRCFQWRRLPVPSRSATAKTAPVACEFRGTRPDRC